jgi:hypothetical protein
MSCPRFIEVHLVIYLAVHALVPRSNVGARRSGEREKNSGREHRECLLAF